MELDLCYAKNFKSFGKVTVKDSTTIADLKKEIHKLDRKLHPNRQSIRLEPKGKSVKDSDTVNTLGLRNLSKIYVRDLGPQIGWKTVFLAEYAGPLAVYLWIYQRPWLFYGETLAPISLTANIAAACYTIHYAKRLLETIFVHRFSHATMPLMNLFKNCSYYWGFTAYVAYHVNHPLFTSPCITQVYAGLAGFVLCELGNFAIHMNLRNLRPPGTTIRRIPMPDSNPLTQLYRFVSCPNYTYEFGAWFSFAVMTQCVPAFLFAVAGLVQMAIWAKGKHRLYCKEFKEYPKNRKAILPFLF